MSKFRQIYTMSPLVEIITGFEDILLLSCKLGEHRFLLVDLDNTVLLQHLEHLHYDHFRTESCSTQHPLKLRVYEEDDVLKLLTYLKHIIPSLELIVGSTINELPLLHHIDYIAVSQGRQAVGYHHDRLLV